MCTILFYSSVDSTAERIPHEGDAGMPEYLPDYTSHSNPQIPRYKSWCTVMGECLTRQDKARSMDACQLKLITN